MPPDHQSLTHGQTDAKAIQKMSKSTTPKNRINNFLPVGYPILSNTHRFVGMALAFHFILVRVIDDLKDSPNRRGALVTLKTALEEVLEQTLKKKPADFPSIEEATSLKFQSDTPSNKLERSILRAVEETVIKVLKASVLDLREYAVKLKNPVPLNLADFALDKHISDMRERAELKRPQWLQYFAAFEKHTEVHQDHVNSCEKAYTAALESMELVHCPLRMQGNYILGTLETMKQLVRSLVRQGDAPQEEWIKCALSIDGDDKESRLKRKFIQFVAIRTDFDQPNVTQPSSAQGQATPGRQITPKLGEEVAVGDFKWEGARQSLKFAHAINPLTAS